MFTMQIILFLIYYLNYLIAIVSDTYQNITENKALAVRDGQHTLNGDYLRSTSERHEEEIEMLVMATKISQDMDQEWNGVTKSIKKRIGESEKSIKKLVHKVKSEVEETKEQIEDLKKWMMGEFKKLGNEAKEEKPQEMGEIKE